MKTIRYAALFSLLFGAVLFAGWAWLFMAHRIVFYCSLIFWPFIGFFLIYAAFISEPNKRDREIIADYNFKNWRKILRGFFWTINSILPAKESNITVFILSISLLWPPSLLFFTGFIYLGRYLAAHVYKKCARVLD